MSLVLEGLEAGNIKKTAHFVYDVPIDGGTAGTKNLGGTKIPKNALIVSSKIFIETAFVGGTSVSFGVVAAADIATAIATATLVIDYAVAGTPVDATGTTWIKTGTSDRGMINVVVGTFSAGRAHLWVDYVIIK
jgi:hypothetical protein